MPSLVEHLVGNRLAGFHIVKRVAVTIATAMMVWMPFQALIPFG